MARGPHGKSALASALCGPSSGKQTLLAGGAAQGFGVIPHELGGPDLSLPRAGFGQPRPAGFIHTAPRPAVGGWGLGPGVFSPCCTCRIPFPGSPHLELGPLEAEPLGVCVWGLLYK